MDVERVVCPPVDWVVVETLLRTSLEMMVAVVAVARSIREA